MQAGQPRRKRLRKALAQMQELFRGVKAGCKAHRLAELIKEIHEQQIRKVEDENLLQVNRHNSTPRSLVLTFSRWRCWALACCFACSSSLRIEGFFSFSRLIAENSRKAAVMTSASRPLKDTDSGVSCRWCPFSAQSQCRTSWRWRKRPGCSGR